MRLFQLPFTRPGKLISMLATASLMFSMTACGTHVDYTGDPADFHGLFINSDVSSSLLGGIRLKSGESLSLYGRFNTDGSIQELEEVVHEDELGQLTSLQFVSGRPSLALLHDGSRIEITYEQVSSTRLKGLVKLLIGPTGEEFEAPFDVDLELALAQVAQMVEDLTGGAVDIDDDSGASAATARLTEPTSATKDTLARQQLGLGALMFAAIIAGAGFVMVCSMAQMMDSLVVVVQASMRPVIIAIFMPLIIMGEICRLATSQPWITINVDVRPIYLPPRRGR
jgi:hypothetical protein